MSKGVKYTNKKVNEISKLHFYLSQYKHIRNVLTMITFKDHKKFSSSNKMPVSHGIHRTGYTCLTIQKQKCDKKLKVYLPNALSYIF